MVEGPGPKGVGGVFICRQCAERVVSLLPDEASPHGTQPDKPFQLGLASLFVATYFFAGAIAVLSAVYQLQNPPAFGRLLVGLTYALVGAGIGALHRRVALGAAFGMLAWLAKSLLL